MLYLVGLGLCDEKDISLKGLDALKNSDKIFVDYYTHIISEKTIENIEKLINKKLIKLERAELEDERIILENSKTKNISLLVGGDPLIATTHISLILSCIKSEINYEIIHSSSIYSAAIGESGLQTYKFGKAVTLVFWEDKYKPISPYEIIYENKQIGLHSLVFIDLHGQKPMNIQTACSVFRKMEHEIKKGLINDDFELIILSRLGYTDKKILFGKLKQIENKFTEIKSPFIIVVPGKLHFLEKEWLNNFEI
ncbi:diphthine synthase [Candidatus Micrarchaeota archaeon]|nr:diphthine synthase [Candidatus Micrarchaeota archaeon]